MIAIRNLTKRIGARTLFSAVSLDVAPGERVALMGPSGSGKSTFLRCLDGLEPFDEGEATVAGHVLRAGTTSANRKAAHALRRDVGLVFQSANLFAHRTALENVIEAPVHVLDVDRATAIREGLALLERFGVAGRKDAFPHELSGGEAQRVAIARALATKPKLLLLDEPTSALHANDVENLLTLLRDPKGTGLTVVVVTHDDRVPRALDARIVTLGDVR